MHTKKARCNIERIDIIGVWSRINHLKSLYRQGWLARGINQNDCESVADHSFSCTLLAWLVAGKYFPHLDIDLVIKYSLVHELGEIFAGDITPLDNVSKSEKHEREEAAVIKVFAGFPDADAWINLWNEFENGQNAEARFVQQIDKLEMALQALIYEKTSDMNGSNFFASATYLINDDKLKEILDEVISLR